MALATVAGLDYDSPIIEFNVRPQPGTVPNEVLFKAQKGTANCEILDVQPDNQDTKQDNGQVYQWFHLRFPDGQTGWLRSHVLVIEGDLTAQGYGTVNPPTYAYRLVRIVPEPGAAPTPPPAPSAETEVVVDESAAPPVEVDVNITVDTDAPTPHVEVDVSVTPSLETEVTVSPTPSTPAPAAPAPTEDAGDLCAGTITAPRGARLREQPVNGPMVAIVPFEAIVTVLEIRSVAGQSFRWLRLQYEDLEGWTREDLLSYSGDCARFNLPVTSTVAARPVEYTEYTGASLYPVPMARYRFVRGFTGHQPNHPGVDYGGDEGEPMLAGPVGGLVVASVECTRCNVPGKPSTVLQGLSLGDPSIFRDQGWNFGFGHYIIVRYLHKQLPPATRQALANRGMPGAHIYAMYAHLCRRDVEEGDLLEPGQVIAGCGNTGNSAGSHLHLELRASTNPSFPGWAVIRDGLVDPLIMFER